MQTLLIDCSKTTVIDIPVDVEYLFLGNVNKSKVETIKYGDIIFKNKIPLSQWLGDVSITLFNTLQVSTGVFNPNLNAPLNTWRTSREDRVELSIP